MISDEHIEDLLSFLSKSYDENTVNSIYNKIKNRLVNVGNYELQSSRSLVYIAVRHPSFFEEAMRYDDPRDIISQGEELSGSYDHWFRIPLNDIDEYLVTAKEYYFDKETESDIRDNDYWDQLEGQEKYETFKSFEPRTKIRNNDKSDLLLLHSKKVVSIFQNDDIVKRIWDLRRDYLYEFFESLSEQKPQLDAYSELDNAIIKDLLDRICNKLYKVKNFSIDNFRKIFPVDIVNVIEEDYPISKNEVFEKMYDVITNKDVKVERERLLRALLIHMNGDVSVLDELMSVLSPEEIIIHVEYENGVRIRNLKNPLNADFVNDNEIDTVKLLALELYKDSLPF